MQIEALQLAAPRSNIHRLCLRKGQNEMRENPFTYIGLGRTLGRACADAGLGVGRLDRASRPIGLDGCGACVRAGAIPRGRGGRCGVAAINAGA